jgi:aspartate racemase
MQRDHVTVGVLGGMGPEATLAFYRRVLELTTSVNDQGHIHLLIDSNPKVPDRNSAVAGTGPSPAPILAQMARGLEGAGADFLVMVCNAAHAFQEAIEAAVSIPFLSIVAETHDEVRRRFPQVRSVGLLASSGCIDANLYQSAFSADGMSVLAPTGADRESFMELLHRVKSGDKSEAVGRGMRAVAESLIEQGAEVVVAGCTEVPLVLSQTDLTRPLVDSAEVLAKSTIHRAQAGLRLERGGDAVHGP